MSRRKASLPFEPVTDLNGRFVLEMVITQVVEPLAVVAVAVAVVSTLPPSTVFCAFRCVARSATAPGAYGKLNPAVSFRRRLPTRMSLMPVLFVTIVAW